MMPLLSFYPVRDRENSNGVYVFKKKTFSKLKKDNNIN